jgi:hypothetical protein
LRDFLSAQENVEQMSTAMFYNRTCHAVSSHDNLRNPCKTFLLKKQNGRQKTDNS